MIDRFDLRQVYDTKLRLDARLELSQNTRLNLGKKDGLISLEVDDHDPKRAAEMANAYVDELRRLTATLALTEAQQRRVFFEGQLRQTRDQLAQAQRALQGIGITAGAIKAEPKAAAEGYARARAELTTAEVRLQVLHRGLSDNAPEVQQQSAAVGALRSALGKLEQTEAPSNQASYIGAYREVKYQETLFDLIARQYEVAKVDESRDGGQVQIVDKAQAPERKSKPKRSLLALAALGLAFTITCLYVTGRLFAARRAPRRTAL